MLFFSAEGQITLCESSFEDMIVNQGDFFFLKQKPNITETPSGQLVKRFSVYQDPEIVYHNLI